MDAQLESKLRSLMLDFLKENSITNLTALRTEEQCWIGNILDSLAAQNIISKIQSPQSRLIDIGSGGGFPLLPLAILFQNIPCTGLDSVAKKNAAVGRITHSQNLANVTLYTGRAEILAHNKDHRERYDIVTARALAPLRILLEYCAPFCTLGGAIIAWKSLHIDTELAESTHAQHVLGCALEERHTYTLPGDFGTRQLLVFKKVNPTPKEYPRQVGIAKRRPL